MNFSLNQNGKYYEDMKLKHLCFDLLIEELALKSTFEGN